MLTTRGEVSEQELDRTVGVEDRPDALALWIEWRLAGELVKRDAFKLHKNTDDVVYTTKGDRPRASLRRSVRFYEEPDNFVVVVEWHLDGELVRTDPNVVLKQPSVVADAIAASIG
jgi:hypothetical protein